MNSETIVRARGFWAESGAQGASGKGDTTGRSNGVAGKHRDARSTSGRLKAVGAS